MPVSSARQCRARAALAASALMGRPRLSGPAMLPHTRRRTMSCTVAMMMGRRQQQTRSGCVLPCLRVLLAGCLPAYTP